MAVENGKGDLISREAAKEAVKYIPWCDWSAVGRTIDELPSIDAVPVVHGRWGYEAGHRGCTFAACRMICDQCGAVVTRIDGGIYNYCPNCGAKMDGEA